MVPRSEHPISRREIDPEALKVLYRLHENHYAAYLVGGSVRDLMLGRRPKDFDVATDAHPYQIKKLFRNCWIIGRRFRLAHVKFGPKTIEVATFRKNVPDPGPDAPVDGEPVLVASATPPGHEPSGEDVAGSPAETNRRLAEAAIIHRDNTFGTPEEDAFRRDFTINGLFYDISTFSVIDYVGGLADLEQRVVRSIGDPRVRFVEDPVRMLRAAVMSARLGFDLDPLVTEAIAEHRELILQASPARLMEEYYKILRSGYAEATFRALGRLRLLELMTPELKTPSPAVWDALARLDRFRQGFTEAPPELSNMTLIGALLVPLGLVHRRIGPPADDPRGDRVSFGVLPIARKDLERLRQVLQMLPRLTDPNVPPRVTRGLPQRPWFYDALVWLDIFGDVPDTVQHWKETLASESGDEDAPPMPGVEGDASRGPNLGPGPRRRRRRRRGRRPV